QITVAVEISKCKSAPNFRARKVAPCFSGRFAEFSSTLIDEKLRWLRVTNIATDVPHGFIYMAVRNCQIGSAIQIDVQKRAAKTQLCFRRCANSRFQRNLVVRTGFSRAIKPNHFVVEIRNRNSLVSRVFEIADGHAHSSASFSIRAEGNATFY